MEHPAAGRAARAVRHRRPANSAAITSRRATCWSSGSPPGNLDPEIRPDTGVSVQGNQSHLAFSGGPHECPGQSIGQAIIETAVDVLLHRLPGLRLAVPTDELTSTASTWEARLDRLPVEFAAAPAGV